jgi:hypothetical protein
MSNRECCLLASKHTANKFDTLVYLVGFTIEINDMPFVQLHQNLQKTGK